MKVFAATLLCMWGCVAGGSVSWPGAIALTAPLAHTLLPAHTKTTSYSTSQYINTLPASYSFAAHPHFAYQIPQYSSFAPLQQQYYPISASHSFLPANVYYPGSLSPVFGSPITQVPFLPSYPSNPLPAAPAYPQIPQNPPTSQPPGDADSAVVDSADFPSEPPKQEDSAVTPTPSQPEQEENKIQPQPDISQFPSFNPLPSLPQNPSFPQFPQNPSLPQFPQFPSNVFPQEPSQPSQPSQPANIPGANNNDKGVNNDDSVSVESA